MINLKLASYFLQEVAYTWYGLWEESCEEGGPPTKWNKLEYTFIDYFLHVEIREALVVEFENLK